MNLRVRISSISVIIIVSGLSISCISQNGETATKALPIPSITGSLKATHIPSKTIGLTPTYNRTMVPAPSETSSVTTPSPSPILDTSLVSPDEVFNASTFTLFSNNSLDQNVFEVPDNALIHSALYLIHEESGEKQLVEELYSNNEMNYWMPWPIAWTADSLSLFYTHRLGGGDGCFTPNNFFGSNLLKYDLKDGTVTDLAPKIGYWIALSPDQTKLAFLGKDEKDPRFETIGIINLKSGVKLENPVFYPTKYPEHIIQYPSHLIWSPQGDKLIYSLRINVCAGGEPYSSLIEVNPTTLDQTIIRKDISISPIPLEWLENGFVLVKDNDGNSWWLNPDDGKLIPPE